MKLVQLLAKELKEWPDDLEYAHQDHGGEIRFYGGKEGTTRFDFVAQEKAVDRCASGLSRDGSRITKSQWQAEREKMNKPKWIRHRGGKCPVADDVKVLYRMRSGTITSRGEPSSILSWDHSKNGGDIMAYRVIEETKDQEIEEVKVADVKLEMLQGDSLVTIGSVSSDFGASVFDGGQPAKGEEVKKTNFGTITYKLEIDATEATKEIDSLVAKWGQIESPLKWRDAIIHCQAIIEDCEREIQRNVNLLDAEGLMMQKDSKKAMQHYAPDVDMSDWRNWKTGDVIEIVANEGGHQFENGEEVIVVFLDIEDAEMNVKAEYKDGSDCWWLSGTDAKFIRRP